MEMTAIELSNFIVYHADKSQLIGIHNAFCEHMRYPDDIVSNNTLNFTHKNFIFPVATYVRAILDMPKYYEAYLN